MLRQEKSPDVIDKIDGKVTSLEEELNYSGGLYGGAGKRG
jgi:hypothetical protein